MTKIISNHIYKNPIKIGIFSVLVLISFVIGLTPVFAQVLPSTPTPSPVLPPTPIPAPVLPPTPILAPVLPPTPVPAPVLPPTPTPTTVSTPITPVSTAPIQTTNPIVSTSPVVTPPIVIVVPVYGCMDSTATNYNSAATSQTGATCTYPTTTVYGCMDSTATNYNSAATSQTGVTCTYTTGGGGGGGGTAPTCSLSVTPTSVTVGSASTLSWSGTDISNVDINNAVAVATSSSGTVVVAPGSTTTYTGTFHATDGQTLTCTATLTVTAIPGGGAGGGSGGNGSAGSGAGGSASTPKITLSVLPHLGKQPLAYLYLSQIPYTGLDLGPVGTTFYWLLLIAWSIVLSYVALFIAIPFVNRRARSFGASVSALLNAPKPAPVAHSLQKEAPAIVEEGPIETERHYSSFDGFKSFARDGALSIEDIVKGLSRGHVAPIAPQHVGAEPIPVPVKPNVEPIYDHVEPVVEVAEESVEPVAMTPSAPATEHELASALIMGDRTAVFAGLRRHVQGGGAPERLLSSVVCLLDDTYRSRIDGSECDVSVARLTARLDTPTLEKLVGALATAIDASYTDGATGAKLALTRALGILGA